jgi:hypothetical protein
VRFELCAKIFLKLVVAVAAAAAAEVAITATEEQSPVAEAGWC